MIQIYSPDNRDYTKNGDMTLFPTEATPRAELNGSWSATLTHPIDKDGRWKYIVENAVVKMPSFNGDQLFRIISKKKADSGVTAQMEPIFYDAISDCWLTDIRPTGKNGQEALDLMLAPNAKYSARSDIAKANTAYYQYVNFFEALNGDIDQSFIKRWGGEILYDNFTIIVNERVGGDYGVELRYGKNIPENGSSEEIDLSGVVTRIYPKAYNGYTMTGNGYVDSPLINNYPITHITTITFDDVKMREDAQEDDEENGVIICDTQEELNAALRKKCQEQYDAGLDKPNVTISADMILLQNTEQYKEYKILETVSLGDTIHCKHSKLGIITDARVISLEYDSLRKKVTAVTLGDYTYNYFDNVTSSVDRIDQVIRPDGSVMADKVAGILNGMYTQLRLQSTAAQKVDGVAFKVEDLDPDSPSYGCMIWGTQGLQISNKRTADDKDWDWTTAFTAKGGYADALVLGILSDQLGRNYWNLETGEFRLSSEAFIGDKTVDDFVSGIFNDKMTQEEIFNALTDNGKVQGIYMENGQLYVNGQYVEFQGAKLGGWEVNGNQLLNNQTNFNVRLQAPTVYGSSGLGTADVFTVHDLTNDTWPFVLTSDGTLDLGDYFKYRPNGMTYDSNVKLSVGGWQIKNGENAWGYDHFEYWDTEQTQENGICSHGPWVIWGGWNQESSLDYVNSYKFVVSDKGDVYGQRFFDNGQQILPVITEVMHVTFTSGWTGIIKDGYFLLNAFLVKSDNSIYVDGIQRRSDGWYLVLLQQSVSAEADLYTVWCKNPD